MDKTPEIKLHNAGPTALTSLGTHTEGVGATAIMPNMLPEPEHNSGIKQSSIRPFNISEYDKYIGKGYVNPNLDLDVLNEQRATHQTGWQLTRNAIGQTGTTILGGTITGIGSTLNFFDTTYLAISQIWDKNAKYKWDEMLNETLAAQIQKFGKDVEQWGQKAMPIYQTKRAQTGGIAGGIGDATWWASMFPTVGSAAASMIPVIGYMKALQLAGKFGMAFSAIGKVGKAANALGRFISNPKTLQVLGALHGAHLDVMEEITRGYDEQYEYARGLGFNDDDARKFASVYAAESYNDAWAYGIVFNAIELNSLMKGIKNAPISNATINRGVRKSIKGIAREGSDYAIDDLSTVARGNIFGKTYNTAAETAKMMLSEGLEEMRVDLALNEGVVAAKKELGIKDETANLGPLTRWGRIVEQSKSWDSFIWGAIGGGVMSGGRGAITKILGNDKVQQENEQKRGTTIINAVQDTAKSIADFDGNMSVHVNETPVLNPDGTQVLNPDGSPKMQRTIVDPASDMLVGIMEKFGRANAFGYATEYFDELMNLSDEELEKIYGAGKRPVVEALSREFNKMRRIFNRNMGLTWGSPYDDILKVQASTQDYLLDYYKRQRANIQTQLNAFDVNLVEAKKANDELLQSINKKLTDLNNRKTEVENLNKSYQQTVNSYEAKLNDKKRKSSIAARKGQITKIDKKIAQVESTKQSYQDEINKLNDYINQQAAISTQQKNRKARKPYILNIKNAKRQIAEIQSKIGNVQPIIDELNLAKAKYEQEVALFNSENEDIKRLIDLYKNSITANNDSLNRINSEIAAERTRENNNSAEYDEAVRRIKETPNSNNQDYQALSAAYGELDRAVLAMEEMIKNRDEIMRERGKLLQDIFNAQNRIDEAQRRVDNNNTENTTPITQTPTEVPTEATTENTNNETTEPIVDNTQNQPAVTVEISKDSNGFSYSLDDNGNVNTVEINGEVYSVGTQFEIAGLPKTVSKLELIEDNQLDFSSVMITFADDENPDIGGDYSAKEFANFNPHKTQVAPTETSVQESTQESAQSATPAINDNNKIFSTLVKLHEEFNDEIYKNKYLETVLDLYNQLTDTNSELYKALMYPVDDTRINEERVYIIGNILNAIENNTPANISKENSEKINKLKQILVDGNTRVANIMATRKIIDYIWNLYGGELVGFSDIDNSNMREAIRDYITNLASVLNNFYGVQNGELYLKDLRADYNVIREQIEALTQTKIQNLSNQFDSVRYADFYHKISLFKNSLIRKVSDATRDFYKSNIRNFETTLGRYINKIRAILSDKDSPLHKSMTSPEGFGSATEKIMKFCTKLNELAKEFLDKGATPNLQMRTEMFGIFQEAAQFIVGDVNELNLTDLKTVNDVRNSSILDMANLAKSIYAILERYYTFESGFELNNEVTVLNSLETIASSVTDIMESDETDNDYPTNDFRYYISDSMRNALSAIEKTIAELDTRQIFSDKHVYTFEDILDAIYQQTDGRNDVIKYCDAIWYALKYFKNDINVNTIYQQMVKNGVSQDQLDALKHLFDIINTRIANPIQTTSNTYLDSNQNLRGKFLTDFFKTHTQREFESNGFRGLRRLTPEVYKILSDPKNYDARTRTIKDNITINGVEFTAQEVFDALRSLKEGQEFNVTIKDGNVDIELDVNGKKLLIERIGMADSETYHNIKLGRTNEDGEVEYDSAFGNVNGTSSFVDTIVRKASNSDTIFNLLKDFYRIYTEAQSREQQKSKDVVKKLREIIHELDKHNNPNKGEHSEIVNAFIAAIQYNSNEKGLSPKLFDLDNLDLDKVYYLVSPMFYNVRLKNLDDYVRYGLRIKNAYQNLNQKLANDFIEAQKLRSEIEKKGTATIVLKGLNKSPITYGESTAYRANVNEELQRTTTINGKPAVNIIERQPNESGSMVVSSLTNDTQLTGKAADRIISEDRHFEIYAEIEGNSGENGKSYVPLHRGNLASDVADTPFNKAAEAFVTQTMSDIITDAEFTNLSSKPAKGIYSTTEANAKANNAKVSDRLNTLSEAIITGRSQGVDWFNISALYENVSPTTGQTTYTKHIDFRTVIRKRNLFGNGISYNNRITIEYEKVGDKFVPTKIRLSRKSIPIGKSTKGRLSKSPYTAREVNQLGGVIEKFKDGNQFMVIDLKSKNVSGKNLQALLGHDVFKRLYSGLQRSVTTARQGNHYTYGIKTNDGYTAVKGKFESKILKWAKRNGVVPASTQDTFDSMQDFILDTGAVTTSISGIRDSKGNIVTNYTIDSVQPAMFFAMKSESIENPIADANAILKANAVKALTTLSESNDTTKNWYQQIVDIAQNKEAALRLLGIIPNNASKTVVNAIVELYDKMYANGNTNLSLAPIGDVDSNIAAQYNRKTGNITINSNVVSKQDFSLTDIGLRITHESLHKFFEEDNNSKKLYDTLVGYIIPLQQDVNSLGVSEFNQKYASDLTDAELNTLKAYLDVLSKQSKEIVTYTFTDSTFADLANRIQIGEAENVKKKTSLWTKILDALLNILGINDINSKSLLTNVRNTVINAIDGPKRGSKNKAKAGVTPPSLPGSEAGGGAAVAERTKITTNDTQTTSDNNGGGLEVGADNTSQFDTDEISEEANNFFDDDDVTFDDNSDDTLNSLTIGNTSGNTVKPGREGGWTPTPAIISNSSNNVLNNSYNSVSSHSAYILDFIDKYIDDNNNKIC